LQDASLSLSLTGARLIRGGPLFTIAPAGRASPVGAVHHRLILADPDLKKIRRYVEYLAGSVPFRFVE